MVIFGILHIIGMQKEKNCIQQIKIYLHVESLAEYGLIGNHQ